MTVSKPAARKLATQAEWTLLESSYAPMLKEITPGRLKQKITRARKLQDKYRDLSRQQRGEARGKRRAKSTRPAAGNDNTENKQLMFSEALERFEAQLAKLEAKAEREAARAEKEKAKKAKASKSSASPRKAAKKPAKKGLKTAKRNSASKVAGKKAAMKRVSKLARATRKQSKLDRTGAIAHQGHVGSRGRRRQARRDSR